MDETDRGEGHGEFQSAGPLQPSDESQPEPAGVAALREEIETLDREALECFARRNDAQSQADGLRHLLDALPRKLPKSASQALLRLIHDARRARATFDPRPVKRAPR